VIDGVVRAADLVKPGLANTAKVEAWLTIAADLANGNFGMFRRLERDKLRLFGGRCSELLHELAERDSERPPLPECSVPYNTNVSFIVARSDLLKTVTPEKKAAIDRRAEALAAELQQKVLAFRANFSERVASLWREEPPPEEGQTSREHTLPAPTVAAGEMGPVPGSLEALVATCEVCEWEFLLEMRTFDTVACTFLEFFWACGGRFHINERYDLAEPAETAVRLFQALCLFQEMFQKSVIPHASTLDPESFGKRYSRKPGAAEATDSAPRRDWAFARHWYSTFVDVLVARTQDSHHWEHEGAALEMRPMPWSVLTPAAARQDKHGQPLPGVSSWGEWHLAVLQGTENEKLAVDLINNLMSSQKISERALRCAGLPTVEEFYKIYRDTPAFRFPDRSGSIDLPKDTFQALRETLFRCARSRTTIFDYRHCMREIHGLIEYLHNTPQTDADTLGELVVETLARIRALRDRELLLL
jgi:hypothetical protein